MEVDDFDLDTDPIKKFLCNKLQYIKSLRDEMKSTVTNTTDLLTKFQQDDKSDAADKIGINKVWKRIFNGKYVVGVQIENKSESPIRDLNVFMQWKPSISPMYITKIYALDGNPGEIFHNEIRRSGILILAIEKPDFLKHKCYEAEAVMQYKLDKSECQMRLETITLDIKDYNTNNFDVKNINLINGNLEAFITAVVCSSEIKLAATMPRDAQRKLENYFVIDCMLRELEFSGCKYFLADGISEIIDGAILKATEINDVYHMDVFYRNKDQLHHFLHYLHSHIRDLNILPIKYELNLKSIDNEEPVFQTQHFVSQKPAVADPDIRKFGECLKNHIEAVADFHVHVVDNKCCDEKEDVSKEYSILRNTITESELSADLLYERLSAHDL